MPATTLDLRKWIERRYHEYSVSAEPVHGTYGLIWFLSDERPNSFPKEFAVKTLAPEKLYESKFAKSADYLRREFRLWLALPHTYNVVAALGFDVASLGATEVDRIDVPVMRMPRMAGSLQDWIGTQDRSIEDRLIVLAQALNGLLFLYDHGLEGHG